MVAPSLACPVLCKIAPLSIGVTDWLGYPLSLTISLPSREKPPRPSPPKKKRSKGGTPLS